MGYTGGSQLEPTYRRMGDHTESFQVDYDATRLSYETLLSHFWKRAGPSERPYSRQYMSAVFYETDAQKHLALETGHKALVGQGGELLTPVLKLSRFYRAEDYHQKYYLRRNAAVMLEFGAYTEREFEDSTAAMWLNACVDGQLKPEALEAEMAHWELSEAERQRMRALWQKALGYRRR